MAKKPDAPYGWRSYRRNLIVLYEALVENDQQDSSDQQVNLDKKYKEIKELKTRTEYKSIPRPDFAQQWADLNEMELRIFRLLDDEQLLAEMERKFAQADSSKLPGLNDLKTKFLAVQGDTTAKKAERRALAFVFLEEMFVKYSYRFADQEKRKDVSRRLTWFGLTILAPIYVSLVFGLLFTFLITVMPELAPNLSATEVVALDTHANGTNDTPANEVEENAAATGGEAQALVSPTWRYIRNFVWFFADLPTQVVAAPFGLFMVVAYSGFVGAYFSRLFGYVSKMQELRVREMDVIYGFSALLVRLLVGAIGALILFYLMTGEILQGAAFPDFETFDPWVLDPTADNGGPEKPLRPSLDFSKLVVWCIVAGFFERFVPDRLEEAQKSAKGSASQGGNSESNG